MGRMHARRRGRSGSHRPMVSENPEWVPISSEEVIELVVKLRKDGNSQAKIGLLLRDQHAVPNVKLATGKSVAQILKENDVSPRLPEDMTSLMRKAIKVNGHLQGNSRDLSNKRGLSLIEAKIRRLERYYRSRKALPQGWKYSLSRAKLEVE